MKRLLAFFWVSAISSLIAAPPDKSSVKPSKISLPSGPGSIEGLGESFEPQLNTGSSSYGVRIAVPPGRAGLEPSVRLAYNSGLGNSFVGMGWTMDFMSIKRQTDKGFPTYTDSDTFLFQGEELVPLNDGTYRCENESGFQRVERLVIAGAKVWVVTEKNGTRHFLGQYAGADGRHSAVLRPGATPPPAERFDATYSWMVDTTIDVHGNRIDYDYENGQGVLYPKTVRWAESGGLFHEAGFLYEDRPDAFDDFRPTFASRIDRRLRRIEVRSSHALVRAYDLSYAYGADDLTPEEAARQAEATDLGVSVLKSVRQYDRSGADNYLPPLRFIYEPLDLAGAIVSEITERPALDLAQPGGQVQIADVNGDGLPDVFTNQTYGPVRRQEVCLNRGPALPGGRPRFSATIEATNASTSTLDLDNPETSLTDMDGDGLTDLVRIEEQFPGRWLKVFHNRSTLGANENAAGTLGFGPSSQDEFVNGAPPTLTFSSPATRQMDLNFDKIPDFLTTVQGSFPAMEFHASYRDPETKQWVHRTDIHGPASFPTGLTFDNGSGETNPAIHLADMNGDRLLDLVQIDADSFGGFQIHYWPYRALGQWGDKRTMTFVPQENLPARAWSQLLTDFHIQDFTGDGLADLLFLDGAGSSSSLNLWVNVGGQKWARRFEKGGLPRYSPNDPGSPTVFRTADLNGNGTTDLLWRNTAIGQDRYDWLELMPGTKANLLTRIDNSLGKRTRIEYGSSTDDLVRAEAAGQPWTTKTPFPVQVVRRLVTSCGHDLNGDGAEDQTIVELQYRDAYFDALEREFRGFAYAQRIDYGDDFRLSASGIITRAPGWNTGATPTGQVSGPTAVTRYRFLTGAPDQVDNDQYPTPDPPANALTDEWNTAGGREEEILKGRQVWEEKVDPWVLHAQDAHGGFDEGARAAALAGAPGLTPDLFVYTRARQEWTVRRLYRPAGSLVWTADQDQDGLPDLSDYSSPPVPAGRFSGIFTSQGVEKSVSYAFVSKVVVENFEANGTLASSGFSPAIPVRPARQTRKSYDHDDYGNEIVEFDEGLLGGAEDDERRTSISYALGGNALANWIIGLPDTVSVTDENGAFVSRTKHYYDGSSFSGLDSGQVGSRGLLHRTQEFKDAATAIEASRTRYDGFGNPAELKDPIGNTRHIAYDDTFHIYPVSETIVVGGGNPDLKVWASYDTGFGTVTSSSDFNGNLTSYGYDSFARLVNIVRPGDSLAKPTLSFEYQPADPFRARLYTYSASGALGLVDAPERSASRVITRQREIAGGSEFVAVSFSDGCGKKLATVEEGENTGNWIVKGATSYNLRGGVQSSWLPYQIATAGVPQFGDCWTSAGRPPTTDGASPAVIATNLYYDAMGREIRCVNPPETWGGLRKFTSVQYLPFEERHFDEEDADPSSIHADTPMVHHMDGLGRLTGVDEVVRITDNGDPGGIITWPTRYIYDLNDQLRCITDSQNNTKTMEFDGLKRMTGMDDPDRGVMTFIYDDASNLKETIDAKNQHIAYTYDGANRIKTEDYKDGGPRQFDVEYFYDVSSGSLAVDGGPPVEAGQTKGQLGYVRDLSGETHFSYDSRARVVWEVKRIPDRLTGQLVNFRTGFGYDSGDRLQMLTYPDGDQLQHGYNPRNLLTRLHGEVSGDIVTSIGYRPSGQLAEIRYGNGVATRYAYDPRLRLSSLDTVSPPPGSDQRLLSHAYSFDGASNITRIDDRRTLTGQPQAAERFNTQSFSYDSLYRLTRVDYPGAGGAASKFVEYRYDRIGNMLRQTSDLTHEENGLPVANLGTMDSGGGKGRSGRVGRDGGQPGPHALTRISRPGFADRSYDYDPNGNMKVIDGLTCTWDFKDRLIAVENDKMRASYSYDYTDRRITKSVVSKSAASVSNPSPPPAEVVHYINKYFELREGDSPVKYVWNGDTRVARVTATLGGQLRTQRLRLRKGWNLVCVAVGGAQTQLDAVANPTIPAAVYWSATKPGDGYTSIRDTTPIPAGAVAWVHSTIEQTLLLSGTTPPATLPPLTGSGQFVGNFLPERLDLNATFPAAAWLARYQPPGQAGAPAQWMNRFPAGHDLAALLPASETFTTLTSGEAMWAAAGTSGNVNSPAAALSVRYYHQDHLGSTSVVTDQAGGLVEETANYAFGYTRSNYKPGPIFSEVYAFTQKERDKESGFHYFEARSFSSAVGRFSSVDPVSLSDQISGTDPQRANAYSYCENNPFVKTDPTGCYSQSLRNYGIYTAIVGGAILLAVPSGGTSLVAGAAIATGTLSVAIGTTSIAISPMVTEAQGKQVQKGFEIGLAVHKMVLPFSSLGIDTGLNFIEAAGKVGTAATKPGSNANKGFDAASRLATIGKGLTAPAKLSSDNIGKRLLGADAIRKAADQIGGSTPGSSSPLKSQGMRPSSPLPEGSACHKGSEASSTSDNQSEKSLKIASPH